MNLVERCYELKKYQFLFEELVQRDFKKKYNGTTRLSRAVPSGS